MNNYDDENELKKVGSVIDEFLAESKGDVPLTMKMLDVVSGVLNDDHDALIDTDDINDICNDLIKKHSLHVNKYIVVKMFVLKMMQFFDAMPPKPRVVII